jgi:hypothetical protein
MTRRTYGSVKDQLARVTQNGMCSDNPQLLARVNEAQERLLNKGLYAGTYARYSVCVYGGCITLPREFESIVGYNFGGAPAQVYNQWYEFMENGPGISPAGDWRRLVDRGYAPTFRSINSRKFLRVYTDLQEDTTTSILFRGSDTYNDRIQTVENGLYIDGERLVLSANAGNINARVSGITGTHSAANGVYGLQGTLNGYPTYKKPGTLYDIFWTGTEWRISYDKDAVGGGTIVSFSITVPPIPAQPWQATGWSASAVVEQLTNTTANAFRDVDAINKTVTKGWVRVYAVDPDTAVESCIAILAPGETLPHYRRYAIPGFENKDGSTVTVLAKRKFIPIVSDDDDLIVSNLGAVKMMLIAIEKEENNNLQEASLYEDKAVELLKEELKESQGSAIGRPQIQMENFAPGEIPAMV